MTRAAYGKGKPLPKYIIKYIRMWCIDHDLKLGDLAKRAGFTSAHISNVMSQRIPCSQAVRDALEKAMNLKFDGIEPGEEYE